MKMYHEHSLGGGRPRGVSEEIPVPLRDVEEPIEINGLRVKVESETLV